VTAQDMIEASRLARVRELQTALTKAAAENGALRAEYGETACAFAGALLFGSDGNIVARQNYGMGRVTFADLPEDDYTLVSLDAQSN
jgi:hypothetical protein